MGSYLLWSTIVTLIMMLIGGIIGLIAENQMATGVIGMPVTMGFLLVPMLANVNETLERIASFLPNYRLQLILIDVIDGNGYGDAFPNILVIAAWIAISIGAFAYTYNKKGLDQ